MKTRKTIAMFLAVGMFLAITGAAGAATIDLSSHFDNAGDFGPVILEWKNNTVVPTASITNVAGPQIRFNNTRTSAGKAILSMFSSATFDPSTQGQINNIDWSARVENVGPTPAILFPMLKQGGTFFMYKGGAIVNSDITGDNGFYENSSTPSSQSLTDALEADFEELDLGSPAITSPPYGPVTIGGNNPDFSAAGGLITLGYLTVSDSGGARTNNADHENITVVVDFTAPTPGEIPEPATMCALGLALAGLGGYVKRRRKLS